MIQIQPQCLEGDGWLRFADEESLFFESLELFSPPFLGNPERREACLAWYRENGRTTAVHGAFIDVNPASGDPEFRDLSRKRCSESCRIAADIGARYVVLHGSCFPFLRGAYIRSWADSCAGFYTELAAAYPSLMLCIENSFDVDPVPLRMLMERVRSTNICVCLDIGHAQYSGTPLAEWFEVLAPWIGYLHLSDNDGKFDDHLAIGEGVIDWREADRLCAYLGSGIPMTLEVGNMDSIRRSLNFLKSNRLFGLG